MNAATNTIVMTSTTSAVLMAEYVSDRETGQLRLALACSSNPNESAHGHQLEREDQRKEPRLHPEEAVVPVEARFLPPSNTRARPVAIQSPAAIPHAVSAASNCRHPLRREAGRAHGRE